MYFIGMVPVLNSTHRSVWLQKARNAPFLNGLFFLHRRPALLWFLSRVRKEGLGDRPVLLVYLQVCRE